MAARGMLRPAMKIDAFTHVRPEAYVERAQAILGPSYERSTYGHPALWDVDARVRHLDEDEIDKQVFGWPFDTVVAMTCLTFGGVLDRFPNLKFIPHHAGAAVPFFEQRMQTHPGGAAKLKRPLLDYYRSFYVDSAIQGSRGGMEASCQFYGADHILFGTDTPYASAD